MVESSVVELSSETGLAAWSKQIGTRILRNESYGIEMTNQPGFRYSHHPSRGSCSVVLAVYFSANVNHPHHERARIHKVS